MPPPAMLTTVRSPQAREKTGIETMRADVKLCQQISSPTIKTSDIDVIQEFDRRCCDNEEYGIASCADALAFLACRYPHLDIILETGEFKPENPEALCDGKGNLNSYVIFRINGNKDYCDVSLHLPSSPLLKVSVNEPGESAVSLNSLVVRCNWRKDWIRNLPSPDGRQLSIGDVIDLLTQVCYRTIEKISQEVTFDSYEALSKMLSEVILRTVPSPSPWIWVHKIHLTVQAAKANSTLHRSTASWVTETQRDSIQSEAGSLHVSSERRSHGEGSTQPNAPAMESGGEAETISCTGRLAILDGYSTFDEGSEDSMVAHGVSVRAISSESGVAKRSALLQKPIVS